MRAPREARFPRSARLKRPGEFRRVFERAKRYQDACFSVLVRPNGGGPARLGLAISRKCARRAVERNRLKRIVRESFRRRRADLLGLDIVVMCRRGAAGSPSRSLYQSIARHWQSIQDQPCAGC